MQTELVTSEKALANAKQHVLSRIFENAQVKDGAEANFFVYLPGKETLKDMWVVYVNAWPPQNGESLKSSTVILISKRSGNVVYEGSPSDEG